MSTLTGMRCRCFVCRNPGSKCDTQLLTEARRDLAEMQRKMSEALDLTAIPDAQLQSEVQRRRNALRKSRKGGRPRKHTPDCAQCGQPMLPVGVKKEINQYDHASGCPLGGRPRKEAGVTTV